MNTTDLNYIGRINIAILSCTAGILNMKPGTKLIIVKMQRKPTFYASASCSNTTLSHANAHALVRARTHTQSVVRSSPESCRCAPKNSEC